MEQKPTKEKEQVELRQICDICHNPVVDKARSDVTRYLSTESRCCCVRNGDKTAPLASGSGTAREPEPLSADEIAAIQSNLGDRYKVLSLLGRGGMGAVYKVQDTQLDRTFAIKVLNKQLVDDASSVKRFEQEAKAASALTHANLVAVYNYGMGNAGSPYIIMDYLDGKNLADILQDEGYLDVPRALDLFIQTAEAMVHAHTKGVIHRDIKPGNIIVEKREGDVELVKLVDFGIAKVLPSEARTTQMTQTGEIFGSPLYMSPEQCLGNKLDARSDIYEMGCVMYEALTGIAPFAADNPVKTIVRHINEDPQPISELKEDFQISPELERIVLHCLERDPANRYQTSVELLKDLTAVRDSKPISLKPPAANKVVYNKKITLKIGAKKKTAESLLVFGGFSVLAAALVMAMVFSQHSPPINRTGSSTGTTTPVSGSPADPYSDATRLDSLSYQYFTSGDYERAIPLLEFGIKTYKKNGTHWGNNGAEDAYLADNLQHIGKCYLQLDQPAKAATYYQDALQIYRRFPNPRGTMMGEAISDYARVLNKLGRNAEADAMTRQWNSNGNIDSIP